MKFTSKLISALAILSFLPTQAFAATNQQVIEEALNRFDTEGSIMHMHANIRVSEQNSFGRETSGGDVAFEVKTKTRPTTDPAITDSDGRFTLSKFDLSSNEDGPFSTLELDAPFVIEWVNRYPMRYIRLQQVPQSVASFFNVFGVNILGIQKSWIGFEWEEDELGDAFGANESFSGINSLLDVTETNGIEVPSLAVGNIERSFRNAKGETITRYRAKMNPAYVEAVYQNKIQMAESDFARRTAESEREEQLRLADALGFAVNYNAVTKRIERIEMGGKVTEDRGNSGTTVTSYAVGITYFPDDQRPIHHPPGWRWFEDIADRLEMTTEHLEESLVELMSGLSGT